MKLHFDLTGYDALHRAKWEKLLSEAQLGAGSLVQLVGDKEASDFIIETIGLHSMIGGNVFTTSPRSNYRLSPAKTFAWDSGDHPTGRIPGLYCALPKGLYNPIRHRSFCYPLGCNPLIEEFPPHEALRLCGFCGGLTTGLRWRMIGAIRESFNPREVRIELSENIWGRLYGGGAVTEFNTFATVMRESKFFLCPRGNGVSSVRLFETMAARRVPVIIADQFVPPQCVDWDTCSVRIKEKDLPNLASILRAHESQWEFLATNARRSWELNFSERNLLVSLKRELQTLSSIRSEESTWQDSAFALRVAPTYVSYALKGTLRKMQSAKNRLLRTLQS